MNDKTHLTQDGYLDQQLLIAMPAMLDPNFTRSVTLMCQHTDEGAIGITINRLSKFSLGEILEQLDIPCSDPELMGGRGAGGRPGQFRSRICRAHATGRLRIEPGHQ